MRILFFFLDGVGLGQDDAASNPFAAAEMPHLQALLDGRRMLAANAPFEGRRASLLALDANLGVSGLPQSATGQATLLTGRNIPAEIGYHYGPKPNQEVANAIGEGGIFRRVRQAGGRAAFLNAFTPGYFETIASGRHLYAAIALSAVRAGVPLRTLDDLRAGQAISADLTGLGLRERLGLDDIPIIGAFEAGQRMARLAQQHDFSLFEFWLSDYAGHGQEMPTALTLLHNLDATLGGLLEAWDDAGGLMVFSSDHGNLEDLSTRRHTANPAPALLIGSLAARRDFAAQLADLSQVAPAMWRSLQSPPSPLASTDEQHPN